MSGNATGVGWLEGTVPSLTRRANAERAFGQTWRQIEDALGSEEFRTGHTTRDDCARIAEQIRYLEGLSWQVGLGRRERRTLAVLRKSDEEAPRRPSSLPGLMSPTTIQECGERLKDVASIVRSEIWKQVTAVEPVRRPVNAGEPIEVVVVDAGRSVELKDRISAQRPHESALEVVAVATNATDGADLLVSHDPHVVVVGMRLTDAPGAGAIHAMRLMRPAVVIVAIAALTNDQDLVSALDAGASAYLTYAVEDAVLADTIWRAATGRDPKSADDVVIPFRDAE